MIISDRAHSLTCCGHLQMLRARRVSVCAAGYHAGRGGGKRVLGFSWPDFKLMVRSRPLCRVGRRSNCSRLAKMHKPAASVPDSRGACECSCCSVHFVVSTSIAQEAFKPWLQQTWRMGSDLASGQLLGPSTLWSALVCGNSRDYQPSRYLKLKIHKARAKIERVTTFRFKPARCSHVVTKGMCMIGQVQQHRDLTV